MALNVFNNSIFNLSVERISLLTADFHLLLKSLFKKFLGCITVVLAQGMAFSLWVCFGVITVLLFCLAFYNSPYKTVTGK